MKKVSVIQLGQDSFAEYAKFVASHSHTAIYYTVNYLQFVRAILPADKTDCFAVLGYQNDKLVAVLPCFMRIGEFGRVANSLPFFGSHGGLLRDSTCTTELAQQMLQTLDRECFKRKVDTLTIIDNLFEQQYATYLAAGFESVDKRIGQFTNLPTEQNTDTSTGDALMALYHSKTRNMVRKALKSEFSYKIDNSEDSVRDLIFWHQSNMQAIGGRPKPEHVFTELFASMSAGDSYDIWRAEQNGEFCAGLLLLYCGSGVEYFTPVINDKYRAEQPLSGLIFNAMTTLATRGFKLWNWGGTWVTQDGVYRFKSRFGATDREYHYFSKHYNKSADILNRSPEETVAEYPYFYVRPFN